MNVLRKSAAAAMLCFSVACANNRPVVGANPTNAPTGTIAGIVSTAGDSPNPVIGRKVTAINTTTGARIDATTAANGGYTLQVPVGSYRLDVELRSGERLAKQPDPTDVGSGDLDAARDFVITR